MRQLPHWCLTNRKPGFYDTESATVVQETAKLYRAMQELINEYNEFVEQLQSEINEFTESTNKNYEEFTNHINKIMHEYIMKIDEKIKMQDLVINNAVDYFKNNLVATVDSLLKDYIDNGYIFIELSDNYNSETEELELVSTIGHVGGEINE